MYHPALVDTGIEENWLACWILLWRNHRNLFLSCPFKLTVQFVPMSTVYRFCKFFVVFLSCQIKPSVGVSILNLSTVSEQIDA